MTMLISADLKVVSPSEADAELARESSRLLAAYKFGRRTSVPIQLLDSGKQSEAVVVPVSAMRLLMHLLTEMSQGNAVTLVPTHSELTTQQAADLLNVSRPFFVKLLDEGKLPYRTVGKYRRVRLDDLLSFKQKDDVARAKILDQLTAEAQELEMGY